MKKVIQWAKKFIAFLKLVEEKRIECMTKSGRGYM